MLRLLASTLAIVALAAAAPVRAGQPRLEMQTNFGRFVVELYPERAPGTVENFLRYVREGFYDDTLFHRLQPGTALEGGAYASDMTPKETGAAIENESNNGLKNLKGALAMAWGADPRAAMSQFFINLADNPEFDYSAQPHERWGYAVFGQVTEGMDVVLAMGAVPVISGGDFIGNVPSRPLVLQHVRLLDHR